MFYLIGHVSSKNIISGARNVGLKPGDSPKAKEPETGIEHPGLGSNTRPKCPSHTPHPQPPGCGIRVILQSPANSNAWELVLACPLTDSPAKNEINTAVVLSTSQSSQKI